MSARRSQRQRSNFNPRALVGRDGRSRAACLDDRLFQSTRPCGARQLRRHTVPRQLYFNPRALVGRDIWVNGKRKAFRGFQSTRPCGARRSTLQCQSWPGQDFNPRALVGRDLILDVIEIIPCTISIHAPLWGATRFDQQLDLFGGISIHAPLWGATPAGGTKGVCPGDFNPRALVGRDGKSDQIDFIRFASIIQTGYLVPHFGPVYLRFFSFFLVRFSLFAVRTA